MTSRTSTKARKRGRKRKPPAKKTSVTPGLIRKLRKPIAPPSRVEDDSKKYQRARERERQRRSTQTL